MKILSLPFAAFLLLASMAPEAQALVPVERPDPTQFETHIREAIELAQQSFDARNNPVAQDFGELGMVYHAHGQRIPARQCYLNAAELVPADARWPYFLGMIAADEGDFRQADKFFSDSLHQNPEYLPTQIRLSRVHIEMGQLARARNDLQAALVAYPKVAAVHVEMARLLRLEGENEQAVVHYREALTLQPNASVLRNPLGMALRDLGDTEQAAIELRRSGDQSIALHDPVYDIMRSKSRSFSYFLGLGLQAAQRGEFRAAMPNLIAAVEIAPENVLVLVNVARAMELIGDLKATEELLGQALKINPEAAPALEHQGLLYEYRGDDLSAEVNYEKSLQSDPSMFDARLLLGNLLMRSGRYEKAAEQYRQLLQHHPWRVDMNLQLAGALYENGDCGGSLEILGTLNQKVKGNAGYFMAYARVAAACPEASEEHLNNARIGMRELYRLDQDLYVIATLAMIEAANGDWDAAVDYQAQVLFVMVRENLKEGRPEQQGALEGYRKQRRPERPWKVNHPLVKPQRITLEDRRKLGG
jgi:tetratricopeptide (TPR) repeat protein